MALVEYKRNDQALENARKNDASGNGFGTYAITPKAGRTTLRIMPAFSEKGVWFHEITEHYVASKQRSFPCTAKSDGRCPICEHGASLAAQGQEETAKSFKASNRFLINVLVLNDPNGKLSIKDGVKVMKIATTVKTALLDLDTDKSGGYGDIVNFHTGMNINLDKSGVGLNTKYTVKVVPQRTSIIDTIAAEGLDPSTFQLHQLDTFVPAKTYEELKGEFGALMSDAPAPEAQPVARPVASQTVVPAPSTPAVVGFTPGAPKVNVVMAPPTFPTKVQ